MIATLTTKLHAFRGDEPTPFSARRGTRCEHPKLQFHEERPICLAVGHYCFLVFGGKTRNTLQ